VADWREGTGWTPELVARLGRDVVADVTRAIETHRPDRVTLVGKSLGTYALGVVLREVALPADTGVVWLTPTWRDEPTFQGALASPYRALYVIGTADPVHVPDRHDQLTNGDTVVLEGADHGFHVDGDILASIDGWRRVAAAVLDFVA
jgi:pimeloyl-ACP methyl ester carboxylesterase